MTLHVEVVVADRELWAGEANMVIAKTLEGDIGVLTGHPPVLGILAEGSTVRILNPEGSGGADGAEAGGSGGEVTAAVSGGFLSVADDQISILAVDAELGREVDTSVARSALDDGSGAAGAGEESTEVKYARAQLRAAGEQA